MISVMPQGLAWGTAQASRLSGLAVLRRLLLLAARRRSVVLGELLHRVLDAHVHVGQLASLLQRKKNK